LHVYELLERYPEFENKLVALDVWSIPNSFYGEQVLHYERLPPKEATLARMVGVQLDSEIRPGFLIYRVMAFDPNGDFLNQTDVRQAGSIAVQMRTPGTYPSPFQVWDIEPLGTVEGTTRSGIVVRIPLIKFWRYHDSGRDAEKPVQITIPPQSYGTLGEIDDWQPEGPIPPPGPDAQRLSVLGLRGGMTKLEAFNLLSQAGFAASGCEDKGNGYLWCTATKDGVRQVKTVFFRDELEHVNYTFPDSEYNAVRKSFLAAYGPARKLPSNEGLSWGTMSGGADLTLGETVDQTDAYVILAFYGGLADQYMKHLAQSASQSAR
jgi:hypothetical protein